MKKFITVFFIVFLNFSAESQKIQNFKEVFNIDGIQGYVRIKTKPNTFGYAYVEIEQTEFVFTDIEGYSNSELEDFGISLPLYSKNCYFKAKGNISVFENITTYETKYGSYNSGSIHSGGMGKSSADAIFSQSAKNYINKVTKEIEGTAWEKYGRVTSISIYDIDGTDFNRIRSAIRSYEIAKEKKRLAEKKAKEEKRLKEEEEKKAKQNNNDGKTNSKTNKKNSNNTNNLGNNTYKKKQEEERKQKAEQERLKKEKLENDITDAVVQLSKIDIPDADLEGGSWGVSYSFNNFHEFGISYNHISVWNAIFLDFDFGLITNSFEAWTTKFDSDFGEKVFDLKQSGKIEEGDILFEKFDKDGNKYSHRIFEKNKIRGYGGNLGVGLGVRVKIAKSKILQFSVMEKLTVQTKLYLQYGHSFRLKFDTGKYIWGLSYNITNYIPTSSLSLINIEKIVLFDNVESYTINQEYNYNGNTINYYKIGHKNTSMEGFNNIKLQYIQLSVAFRLK